MIKAENRRARRFVDPTTQRRIVLGLTVVPLLVLLAAAVVMWVSSERLFDEAEQSDALLPSLGFMTLAQFVFVVIAGCVVMLQAVRYSHRVAGPAHRIVESLRQVREGHLKLRIRLRGQDELVAVADEVNAFLDWLEHHPPSGLEPLSASDSEDENEESATVTAQESAESHA